VLIQKSGNFKKFTEVLFERLPGADQGICEGERSHPFPSVFPSPSHPLLFPLESHLKPARGMGKCCKLPRGSGASPGRKRIWCIPKLS